MALRVSIFAYTRLVEGEGYPNMTFCSSCICLVRLAKTCFTKRVSGDRYGTSMGSSRIADISSQRRSLEHTASGLPFTVIRNVIETQTRTVLSFTVRLFGKPRFGSERSTSILQTQLKIKYFDGQIDYTQRKMSMPHAGVLMGSWPAVKPQAVKRVQKANATISAHVLRACSGPAP